MTVQICWRCLSKAPPPSAIPPGIVAPYNVQSTAAFATSAALLANPIKKKSNSMKPQIITRGSKQTFTKKKKKAELATDRSKAPAIGERRALRKRVVLSNTNALEVQGLRDVNTEDLLDERSKGQVLGIPGQLVDQLRAVEAFKVAQGWGMYRRPAMLMREETLEYAKMMEGVGKETVRRVIVGERGSGKTTMLLQAMTMAFLKGWVVINIPEGTFNSLPTHHLLQFLLTHHHSPQHKTS